MKKDSFEVDDYKVVIKQSREDVDDVDECGFEEPVIGMTFYGLHNVPLTIENASQTVRFEETRGIAMSFYSTEKARFIHSYKSDQPMKCICISLPMEKLKQHSDLEPDFFQQYTPELVNANTEYLLGPNCHMTHYMQEAIQKIFNTTYEGASRQLLLRSQVTELLAHFFAQLSQDEKHAIRQEDRDILYMVKDMVSDTDKKPPTLEEISRVVGYSPSFLKKKFKEEFGEPIYQYALSSRLQKAHDLLSSESVTIKEAAWQAGYESTSSFSNAFIQKFGYRPSKLKIY